MRFFKLCILRYATMSQTPNPCHNDAEKNLVIPNQPAAKRTLAALEMGHCFVCSCTIQQRRVVLVLHLHMLHLEF